MTADPAVEPEADARHGHHAHGDAPSPRTCANCAAALQGPFCGFCGQRAIRLDVSLRELLREGVHEFVHLDLRILVTLRLLLTRPGRLTSEMLAGRRQRYISPVRMYLVCSLLFFVGLAIAIPAPQAQPNVSGERDLQVSPNDRALVIDLKKGATRVAGDPAGFMDRIWSRAPKVAFALVPVFALLTMATFRRRVRFFVPHLYFALHFHCFVFLASLVLLAIDKASSLPLASLSALLAPGYLVVAARETFETGWGEALWKALLVSVLYGLLLLCAVAVVLVLSVMYW
jgi:hypothetical protein